MPNGLLAGGGTGALILGVGYLLLQYAHARRDAKRQSTAGPIDDAAKANRILSTTNASLLADLEDMRKALSRLHDENTDLRRQLDDERRQRVAERRQAEEQRRRAEAKIADLERKLAALTSEVSEFRAQIAPQRRKG